jgi:hypothetical protein
VTTGRATGGHLEARVPGRDVAGAALAAAGCTSVRTRLSPQKDAPESRRAGRWRHRVLLVLGGMPVAPNAKLGSRTIHLYVAAEPDLVGDYPGAASGGEILQ